ncbi:MAG TPA: SUMF1/EgtB/PvdO family nonheme iron enzyme [Chthonomonadaceae bacterium]|nr:SUMF1/EgtB/PvdO family nonheme iron enzyme [Chthonomonadaceae bacterium]
MINQSARKAQLHTALRRVRAKTLWLMDHVPEAHLKARVHDFYSPVGWHFGHIGMTEEYWVWSRALGRPCLDSHLSFLFANIDDNPKDNRVHLPSREEIKGYLEATRRRTLQALEAANLEADDPLLADGYAWEFALQHECQHQESITELLQLIQKERAPEPPSGAEAEIVLAPASVTEMIAIPGGAFRMGSNDRHGYDNEKVEHQVEVAPFQLERTPVSAAQWVEFIQEGGYRRKELWTEEGWAWRQHEGAEHPEYWRPHGKGYLYYSAVGLRSLSPGEPVSSISWYEADAYARWQGKRLPTEAEWEYAAAWDPATGRTRRYPWGDDPEPGDRADYGLQRWAPLPVGGKTTANALGLCNMAGGVWEWTAKPFLPYPGFRAFPYDGYSKDHMDGKHYVCRGGSWATAAPILRCSFRNWYVPTYRQGFLGVRCAR